MLAEEDPHARLVVSEPFACGDGGFRSPGIGVRLRAAPESGMIRVVTAFKDGPAHRAGIRPDDLISCITLYTDRDGEPLLCTPGFPPGLQLPGRSESMLVGKEGTRVELTIRAEERGSPSKSEVLRGAAGQETVLGWKRRRDDGWTFWIDPDRRIAYVRITRLARQTAAEMESVLKELIAGDMRGLILDLRGNPGGLLQATTNIARICSSAAKRFSRFAVAGSARPCSRATMSGICPPSPWPA